MGVKQSGGETVEEVEQPGDENHQRSGDGTA